MMEYYSAIKWNEFESVLVRWVKLEPVIQREISQKNILMYIYGIEKNSTGEPICRAGIEMQA